MKDGLAFVDNIGWDAFNEGKDLKQQVESYKQRHGYYTEVVLADQLYGSHDNRKYLKERGIRFGGKPLGRPRKVTTENIEEIKKAREQRKRDNRERIPIEGKFGQGKNGYRLNYVRAKCQRTSEAWINSIFLVMNLMVLFREVAKIVFSQRCFWVTQCFALLKEAIQRSSILVAFKVTSRVATF